MLGVDNVVFISILAAKLPEDEQDKARKVGLLAAAGLRIVLLMVVGSCRVGFSRSPITVTSPSG